MKIARFILMPLLVISPLAAQDIKSSETTDVASESVKTPLEKVVGVNGRGSLRVSDEVLEFDLGEHLSGSRLDVNIEVINDTNKHLNVQLQPSCGCTKLSVDSLSAAPGGKFVFKPTVLLPLNSGKVEALIACLDVDSGFRFTVAMVAKSMSLSKVVPGRISVSSNEPSQTLDLLFSKNSDLYSIDSIESLDPSRVRMVSLEKSGEDFKFRFEYSILEGKQLSEQVTFKVGMRRRGSDVVTFHHEKVEIDYADRLRIGPSMVQFSAANDGLSASVYLISSQIGNIQINEACLVHNGNRLPLEVQSSSKRGDRALALVLAATLEDWKKFMSVESVSTCSLMISTKTGAEAKAEVVVVGTKDQ